MTKKATLDFITVSDHATAVAALQRMEELTEQIAEIERQADAMRTESIHLKKSTTEWASKTKTTVVQLDGVYFRLVQRYSRSWDNDLLRSITKNITVERMVKGKKKVTPLFNLITKRVADPDGIQRAVANGWITQKKIEKAFIEKPQAPFLQRYQGDADGDKDG